jgi:PTH1 family peptidyl-tRNA hydrolase
MVETSAWLLVGLGNPGPRYAHHRHNVGFRVAEAWLREHDPLAGWRDKWDAKVAVATLRQGRCVVLEPQTFMNRSGKSVVAAAGFYRVPAEQIIVVHDELDFEFGRIGVKAGGGHGGHNGLRDIVELLGSRDFLRIRVGIGRPARGDATAWVLSDFDAVDEAKVGDVVDRAVEAITAIMRDGVEAAQNRFNREETESQQSTQNSGTSNE